MAFSIPKHIETITYNGYGWEMTFEAVSGWSANIDEIIPVRPEELAEFDRLTLLRPSPRPAEQLLRMAGSPTSAKDLLTPVEPASSE